MADKKRNINGYEEMYAVQLGGGEVILAENKTAEARYMVCDCSRDNPLGAEMFQNGVGSADFVEMMKEFTRRIFERVVALEIERETRGIPLQMLTADDCHPAGRTDLAGCVVVIKPESLAPEYRSIDYQLALCTGGFGASPDSNGRAVYCQNLISGEKERYNRSDIAGTVSEDRLPDWARINLDALRQSASKESVLEKIKQDRQDKQQNEKQEPKSKKHKKDGQDL